MTPPSRGSILTFIGVSASIANVVLVLDAPTVVAGVPPGASIPCNGCGNDEVAVGAKVEDPTSLAPGAIPAHNTSRNRPVAQAEPAAPHPGSIAGDSVAGDHAIALIKAAAVTDCGVAADDVVRDRGKAAAQAAAVDGGVAGDSVVRDCAMAIHQAAAQAGCGVACD